MKSEFSVLMSVYNKEKPLYLKQSLESILNQTLLPSEIVIVCDGILTKELDSVLSYYDQKYNDLFKIIRYEKNMGLGYALSKGVKECSYEIIARMDTDDIAIQNRFELQISYLDSHPECSLLGGQIEEFIKSKPFMKRAVPLEHKEICKTIRIKNPFNHMTVMFKKNAVLKAGNYKDFHFLEDYFLWIRMYEIGIKFANLKDTLVYARVGKEMYKRRGGFSYFESWKRLNDYKLKNHIIKKNMYYYSVIVRFITQVMLPSCLRGFIFKVVGRKRIKKY